ncbi:RidA family protein [Marispirochaeta aestuarii]|uniref:RidA family protein n=1 Tax=Marispirochaeta aestuarii TaxID=1963862 RepID=UPI0029C83EFE|nr:RidA family protein [Marispirochaeta aestuarii]
MKILYLNPDNMAEPRGYSHAISVLGNHRTIYIGGQNAIDEKGDLVGTNDLELQTEQVLINIRKVLAAAGAKLENVIKFTIYILQGQDPLDGFRAFQKQWGDNQRFPAVTVLFVPGLGHPDWLVEIDAIAAVPE